MEKGVFPLNTRIKMLALEEHCVFNLPRKDNKLIFSKDHRLVKTFQMANDGKIQLKLI